MIVILFAVELVPKSYPVLVAHAHIGAADGPACVDGAFGCSERHIRGEDPLGGREVRAKSYAGSQSSHLANEKLTAIAGASRGSRACCLPNFVASLVKVFHFLMLVNGHDSYPVCC